MSTPLEHLHPATDKLSLLAKVGELVVAIDATQVFQIHSATDLPARQLEPNLHAIELPTQTIPAWDLGELFAYGASTKAWVIVDAKVGSSPRRFGLRVGACLTVRKLSAVHALPQKLFATRPGAMAGAFSTSSMPEIEGAPSGVVLDLAKLLTEPELAAADRVARSHGGPR